jgi:hypothetical protein
MEGVFAPIFLTGSRENDEVDQACNKKERVMHIPLPKTGDTQSLEAFAAGLREFYQSAEPHIWSIFGSSKFLNLSRFEGMLHSDRIFAADLLDPRFEVRRICSFSWRTDGRCEKTLWGNSRPPSGSGLEVVSWREGAIELLGIIASQIQTIPAEAALRIQEIRDAAKGLVRLSTVLGQSLQEEKPCA